MPPHREGQTGILPAVCQLRVAGCDKWGVGGFILFPIVCVRVCVCVLFFFHLSFVLDIDKLLKEELGVEEISGVGISSAQTEPAL